MAYTPVSPFMRPISFAHLRVVADHGAPAPSPVNKWKVLRDLSKAQSSFAVSDRDLAVLQALLSFHPDDEINSTAAIVFPSNKTICERLHGMPCSTMRRHLARLVDAGLITRRDSPTGKRYVRKSQDGESAFGFDLSPLNRRAGEIALKADETRQTESRISIKRETISLMRRDLAAVTTLGRAQQPGLGFWDELQDAVTLNGRELRRKLTEADLDRVATHLAGLIDDARSHFDKIETSEMSTDSAQNEQRLLNTNKESYESEPIDEGEPARGLEPLVEEAKKPKTSLPLSLVTNTCLSLRDFYPERIQSWEQLVNAASDLRASMGVSLPIWRDAVTSMGREAAAVTLLAMLERFSEIRNPSGYLRSLAVKAGQGNFTPSAMIMALNRSNRAA